MEKTQKEKSQYVRSLLEASLDPLVTISAEGKITDVNEASIKATGVSRENLIGTDFSNYFTEPKKAQDGYQQVFEKSFVSDYPLTIKHKNGNLTDVLYNASVYKDEEGGVLGVFAAARDITAQKQSSQYARSLIEASLDPLVTINAEGKITDVNEASVKVTGIKREKLIGTDFSNYFTEPLKAKQGYKKVFDKGFVADYPLTIKNKKGELTDVLYNASVYKDDKGNVIGVFAAARDVTEQKWAIDLRIANKELAFQNEEKEKRAAELVIANKELAFQNDEKEKRANELGVANKELTFQNEEKEKRAAELVIANKELAFQNDEKEKRANELGVANKELTFQNDEKEKRANELSIANKELAFQNNEKEKRAEELLVNQEELEESNSELELQAQKLKSSEEELKSQSEEKERIKIELEQQIGCLNEAAIVYKIDAEGNITFVNDKFCEISGFKRIQLLGENHQILKNGKQSDGLFAGMRKAISVGKVWKGEVLNKKKGIEEYYWMDTTIMPFKNVAGEIIKYVGICFDITAQKDLQAALMEKAEEIAAQAEELQVNQEELEESNSELELQAQKLQSNEEELNVQHEELLQSNQELEEKGQLLEEKNQTVNEKNEALEMAREELETKAEELEITSRYKSEFLANMSHELRTPLNSILLLSKLLSDNYNKNLTEEQIEFSSVIYNSGNSLLELINEILDLSKIEAGKMDLQLEELELKTLTKGLEGIFKPLSKEKNISCHVTIEKNVKKTIVTDRIRLEQILKNLISNAIKFTQKGEVKLHIYKPTKNTSFQNPLLKSGAVIAYSVSDTGIGVPKNKQALIFEAFQQADGSIRRQYGGTGLGLSISREIASMLGGEISLESEEGKGSTFTLYLPSDSTYAVIVNDEKVNESPITKEEEKDVAIIDKNIVAFTPKEIKDDRNNLTKNDKVILIVEDDTNFAQVLIKFSHDRGYKAVVSVSGGTALAFARKYKPIGILLDILLPVKSGWSIMTELKENIETKSIPVHMMSCIEVSRKQSVDVGAIDFINKPLAEKQIQQVFDKIKQASDNYPKRILLIEDNEAHHIALKAFLGNGNKKCLSAYTAVEGMDILEKEKIDCVILDMGLPYETGYQLLEKINKQKKFETLPVIVYTGKSLSLKEEQKIKKYARTIVIRTADSYKRLMDEVSLFLHLVEEVDEVNELKKRKPYIKEEALFNKKVLLVDDDIRNIFSITKTLENQNMIVTSANNGEEALKILENQPDIEVILMDMMMPEKDGYETMEEIRKQEKWKDIPIIAVTAKAMLGDRDKCIKSGASDYISKPVDVDQLVSLLRVWLHKK